MPKLQIAKRKKKQLKNWVGVVAVGVCVFFVVVVLYLAVVVALEHQNTLFQMMATVFEEDT